MGVFGYFDCVQYGDLVKGYWVIWLVVRGKRLEVRGKGQEVNGYFVIGLIV
jgi:hypothetical protein